MPRVRRILVRNTQPSAYTRLKYVYTKHLHIHIHIHTQHGIHFHFHIEIAPSVQSEIITRTK